MKKSILSVLLCAFLVTQIKAQVYVSTTGIDAFGRGSLSMPYKTISFAVGQAASGNAVYISSGIYYETNVIYVNKSLTLVKNGSGNVVIDGTGRTVGDTYMMAIVDASNVVVDGLIFQNYITSGAKGIWVLGSGSNITVKNCQFTNIGWINNNLTSLPSSNSIIANAIAVQGDKAIPLTNILIQNNEVSNCATGWGEAVTIGANVDGFVVDNNKIHHISNIGIDATGNYYRDFPNVPVNKCQARNGVISNNEVYNCMSGIANSAGIYLDGALNCTIEKNKSYNNGVGIAIGGEETLASGASQPSGHKMMNNIVNNNCVTGIFLGSNNATVSVQNTTVFNNTFYKNRTGQAINGVTSIDGRPLSYYSDDLGGEISLQNSSSVTFKNNIVYPINGKKGMLTYSGSTVSDYKADYNVYFRDNTADLFAFRGVNFNGITTVGPPDYATIAAFTTATSLESHSFFMNPSFTNAASSDFSLTNTAFAINKGDPTYDSNISGLTDFIGNQRKISTRVDAGAYENQSPVLPVTFVSVRALEHFGAIRIEWSTASESNNSHFEVQKSEDGSVFYTIGIVKSKGNTTQLNAYNFDDNKPNRGINYYRIKQVDVDGKSELTKVISVDWNTHQGLQVFPNPAKDKLVIACESTSYYKIINIFGHEIMNGQLSDNQTELDISALPSGLYWVKTKETFSQFFKN
jgi:parallel beta-helix repeat protein